MIHRVELDSIRKYRSPKEWRPVGRARCGDIESVGDGSNLRAVLQKMADLGMSGPVEVVRGQTVVFPANSLENWLRKKPQPAQLRKAVQNVE